MWTFFVSIAGHLLYRAPDMPLYRGLDFFKMSRIYYVSVFLVIQAFRSQLVTAWSVFHPYLIEVVIGD